MDWVGRERNACRKKIKSKHPAMACAFMEAMKDAQLKKVWYSQGM